MSLNSHANLRAMHVIDSLGVGGAERHLLHMAAYLRTRGVDQVVVQLSRDRALSAEFSGKGVDVIELGYEPGIASFPGMYWKLLECARDWRPQVISTQLTSSDIVGRLVARRLQIPTLSTWQATRYGALAARSYSPRVRLAMAVLRGLDRLSVAPQSRFIAVSKSVEASYLHALSIAPSRCRVIPNTVDFGRFPEAPVPRDSVGKGIRLVHVGIHLLRKDIRTLLEAMSLLPATLDVTLDLVGAGPLTPVLERYVLDRGLGKIVRFNGVIADVVPVLLNSDVFVLPSLTEGFSLAYLEALAAGLPVIASDIPENREMDPQGRASIFFMPGDAKALAATIEKLSSDHGLRAAMAKNSRSLVRRYQIDQIGPAYLESLLSAVAPSGGRESLS